MTTQSDDRIPTPKTRQELVDYIDSLVGKVDWDTPSDDGTGMSVGYAQSADAMWKAAVATFNFVARELGTTGFQAGYAAFQFMRRVLRIDGPFGLVRADPDMLYPQYEGPAAKAAKWEEEWKGWAAEEAAKKLGEGGVVHPDVIDHWKSLVREEGNRES